MLGAEKIFIVSGHVKKVFAIPSTDKFGTCLQCVTKTSDQGRGEECFVYSSCSVLQVVISLNV